MYQSYFIASYRYIKQDNILIASLQSINNIIYYYNVVYNFTT